MDHAFRIFPTDANPASHIVVVAYCDPDLCKIFGVASRKSLNLSVLLPKYQHAGLWLIHKTPVVDVLHIKTIMYNNLRKLKRG